MIKVLLADDSNILTSGLKIILEQYSFIEVVGCAKDGREAALLCDKYSPDIVIMDIRMPGCDGIEGTRLIKEKHDKTKILILTTFNDKRYISEALKYGADGYILKDIRDDDLINTIKCTMNGLKVMQENAFEDVRSKYVRETQSQIENKTLNQASQNVSFTDREIDILKLIVSGKKNKEIASTLHLAEGSLRNMVSSMLEKYQLNDRTDLAIFAIKNNLI